MPKFIIERVVPGLGSFSPEQLQGIAVKSCDVLREMGPTIQWVESYVTDDKFYCVYNAPNADMIRQHAHLGGFPADEVNEVRGHIDPTTAETKTVAGTIT
ncbi:MAG TPA: DUF4242 domain-containing protein [Candidatus Baltobacteraceae bacterium]|nr:DUF4242 domain-containing protein [Candidatus Baltobacteraceae bacterium]